MINWSIGSSTVLESMNSVTVLNGPLQNLFLMLHYFCSSLALEHMINKLCEQLVALIFLHICFSVGDY